LRSGCVRLLDERKEVAHLHGLAHDTMRAEGERSSLRGRCPIGSHHDDRTPGGQPQDGFEQLQIDRVGQAVVEQDDVGHRAGGEALKRLLRTTRLRDVVARVCECFAYGPANQGLVVDDQTVQLGGFSTIAPNFPIGQLSRSDIYEAHRPNHQAATAR
jgi:hypothetical protein